MRRFLPVFTVLFSVLACDPKGSIESEVQKPEDFPRFIAQTESRTKVHVDGIQIKWNADDGLTIYTAEHNRFCYYKADPRSNGSTSGDFDFVSVESYGGSQGQLSQNIAIFPRQAQTVIQDNGSSLTAKVDIPAVQPLSAMLASNSSSFPMIAATTGIDDHNLHFRNICSILVFQILGSVDEFCRIERIVFRGNNGEQISGTASVSFSNTLLPQVSGWIDSNDSIELRDTGNSILLDSKQPAYFYVVVPPTYFANGFTLSIYDDRGNVMDKGTEKQVTVERGELITTQQFVYTPSANPEGSLHINFGEELSADPNDYTFNFGSGDSTDPGLTP